MKKYLKLRLLRRSEWPPYTVKRRSYREIRITYLTTLRVHSHAMMRLNVVVYFILERLSWQSRRVSVVIAREFKSSTSYLIHTLIN